MGEAVRANARAALAQLSAPSMSSMFDLAVSIYRAAVLKRRIKRTEQVLEQRKERLAAEEQVILVAAEKVAKPTESGGRSAILEGIDGQSVHVSFPRPSLKLSAENLVQARKLAGPAFAKLAEKVSVPFKLVKSARELAGVLLTPARAKKFCDLLASDNSPRLTYR